MALTQPLTDVAIAEKIRQRHRAAHGVPANGCTRESPRCPDAREYNTELRECCKGHLRQIVRDVAAVLGAMGIEWWADYGTLLGAVRNPMTQWSNYPWLAQTGRTTAGPAPGIAPHDKDVDLGMRWPGSPRWSGHSGIHAIAGELRKMGYDISLRRNADNLKVRLSARNHSNADLFSWHERSDGMMHRTRYIMGVDRYKGRDFRAEDAFPLTTVEWEGMTLPAPKNPAAFCAFRYGPNWQIPLCRNNDGVVRGVSR